MKEMVDTVLSLSSKKIEKSCILFSLAVPDDLPQIRCRPEQLEQVLMNLIINAVHALDERYPETSPNKCMSLTVQKRTLQGQEYLVMTVEDRGTGMSEATRMRLFDPFFTTKGRDKGTGLGLSVSDGIVKDHGGFFEVYSESGSHTIFNVFLPVAGPDKGSVPRTDQTERD